MIIEGIRTKRGTTYDISRDGTVTNLKTGRALRPYIDHTGYTVIKLDGKVLAIHRLVAEAFLPNPNGYDQINHKNEDKTDNRVENLEWCTQTYNLRYSKCRPIVCIETREVFPSPVIAFQKRGACLSSLYCIINSKRGMRRSGGYHWRLATDEDFKGINVKEFLVGEEPIIIERRK